jgi:uncharacterized protein YraI
MTPPTWLGTVVTAPAGTDLRTHPDPHAPVIRTIVCGDRLRVHGVPLQGGDWYAVTYGAQSGYVLVRDVGATDGNQLAVE